MDLSHLSSQGSLYKPPYELGFPSSCLDFLDSKDRNPSCPHGRERKSPFSHDENHEMRDRVKHS